MPLPVPVGVARDRLLDLLERGGLRDAAAGAFAAGQTVLLRAGFAGPTEQVAVRSLPPYRRGPSMVVLVRWVLTGPAAGLFPPLDANLELDPARDGTSRLTLSGSYRPPVRRSAATLDGLLLRRAARAAVHGFLTRIARAVLEPPAAARRVGDRYPTLPPDVLGPGARAGA